MKNSKAILKLTVLAMLIALGVVISPILRVEGMCPMAHLINIVCSVLLGPWYSLLCATLIGIIRMVTMGIPPIALTGAIFGAFLSGVFYRLSKGKIIEQGTHQELLHQKGRYHQLYSLQFSKQQEMEALR